MIPVGEFMPAALQTVLRHAPLTPEKVAFAWRLAVGAAVDKATTIELRDGVLRVEAKDAAWQREIERSAGVVRARLEALLGPRVVRSVSVTADSPAAASSAAAARSGSAPAAAGPDPSGRPSASESDSGRRHR